MGFDRGLHTLFVSAELHKLNRSRLVDRLRKGDFFKKFPNSAVLLQGGESGYRHCSDHEPIFRQESFFHWTFGVQEPDYFGAIDLNSGKSFLFAPKLPESYAVWSGSLKTLDQLRKLYEVDEVHWVENMKNVLASIKTNILLTLHGVNSDSKSTSKSAEFPGIEEFTVNKHVLYPEICECRVFKTELEKRVLRYVSKLSSEAHKEVMRKVRPGMMEYQMESIFQNFCSFNAGTRFTAYTCICATGKNGAILHYGHAGEPNGRQVNDGDMCMLDMGAEYYCYAADISCSYPVNGVFTEEQKFIYEAVLNANLAVQNALKPGVSWLEMHKLAEEVLLSDLKKGGLLQGNVNEMMQARLGAIFMPHGLGHFMGIDTHDVGGYLPGHPERSEEQGLCSLRTARIMQKDMCITVEPGCYFIEALLQKAFADPILSKFLVKDKIAKFENFGGVRIEDDVLITENGIENLTKVPRTVAEIEALMAEGKKNRISLPQEEGSYRVPFE